jgi:excisionase family DNA binding protein
VMADVSRALTITDSAARELVSALDALERLAGPQGQRLSGTLHTLRRELATCVTRVSAPVGASADDVAALLLTESSVMDPLTAAAYLGLTPDGVRWLCRHGHLTAARVRGRWLIDRISLQTYVAVRDRTR